MTFDGRLWASFEPPADWPAAVSELRHQPWARTGGPVSLGTLRAVVSGRWHYIENDGAGRELFDRLRDPREQNDLGKQPEVASVLDQMRARLPR